MNTQEKKQPASIAWFEIPADNPDRAKAFYSNLFGWKINPFPGGGDYWHIDTGGADDAPDGALKRRKHPQEPVVNYVSVDSVDKFADKIGKNLHGENGRAADGLFRRVQGYRREPVWNLAD